MYNFAQICLIYFDNISISYGLHFCRSHVFEKYTFFLFPLHKCSFSFVNVTITFSRKEWLVSVTIEKIENGNTKIFLVTFEPNLEHLLKQTLIFGGFKSFPRKKLDA